MAWTNQLNLNPDKIVLVVGASAVLENGCIPMMDGAALIPQTSVCGFDPGLILVKQARTAYYQLRLVHWL